MSNFTLYFVDKKGGREQNVSIGDVPNAETLADYVESSVQNGKLTQTSDDGEVPTYKATSLVGDFMEVGEDGNGYIYNDFQESVYDVKKLVAKLRSGQGVPQSEIISAMEFSAHNKERLGRDKDLTVAELFVLALAAQAMISRA